MWVFKPSGFGFTGSQAAKEIVDAISELLISIKANQITAGGRAADVAPLNDEGLPPLDDITVVIVVGRFNKLNKELLFFFLKTVFHELPLAFRLLYIYYFFSLKAMIDLYYNLPFVFNQYFCFSSRSFLSLLVLGAFQSGERLCVR